MKLKDRKRGAVKDEDMHQEEELDPNSDEAIIMAADELGGTVLRPWPRARPLAFAWPPRQLLDEPFPRQSGPLPPPGAN